MKSPLLLHHILWHSGYWFLCLCFRLLGAIKLSQFVFKLLEMLQHRVDVLLGHTTQHKTCFGKRFTHIDTGRIPLLFPHLLYVFFWYDLEGKSSLPLELGKDCTYLGKVEFPNYGLVHLAVESEGACELWWLIPLGYFYELQKFQSFNLFTLVDRVILESIGILNIQLTGVCGPQLLPLERFIFLRF